MPLLDDPWLPQPDDSGSYPAVWPAPRVRVYRFDGHSTLTELPNVECLSIARREGTDPGHATFRYDLASTLDGAPRSIEEALGTGFVGDYAVNAGDRLVVRGERPDGEVENLFDGLAMDFGMALDPDAEEVHLGAVGVARRAWDDVIGGAIMRASDFPKTVDDTETDVPAHFNPGGLSNCIPDGAMAGDRVDGVDQKYPTFLDGLVVRSPDVRTKWTLPKAIRYILFTANPDEEFVVNMDGQDLDALLVSPSEGGDTGADILCPDTPITGRDWPTTVHRLVTEVGFGMRFELGSDDGGMPLTRVVLFRPQDGPVKQLYLAPRGTPFDPSLFNFNSGSLHRDVTDVVNSWTVRGGLDRYEASFVLAPGFPMTSSDASQSNLIALDRGQDVFLTTNRDKYRLYVFDETGEGHYAIGTTSKLATVPDLDALLGKKVEGKDQYVRRRRRPIGDLVSVDAKGQPFKARLAISTNYAGTTPGLWDGTGTWQQVTASTWRLLPDRLGIEITAGNPNEWNISKVAAGSVITGGVVNGVEYQATSQAGISFFLRLTCVVEADKALAKVAEPRGGSPLAETIHRVVDASDRYRVDRVYYPSEFNKTSGEVTLARDDRDAALAEAEAIRAGTEAGVLSGPVTIPRLTTYYRIGDRISEIEGRGLGLRTDQGSEQPVYPVVVGVSHSFAGGQTTTLELSDAGTDRKRHMRPAGRPVRDSRDMARPDSRRY